MKQKRFCAPTVIHGLLEIQKVRDKFKAQNIQLTYAESIKIGNLAYIYLRLCPINRFNFYFKYI